LSSGEESDTEKSKKRRKKEKKSNKTPEDKSKDEHEPDEEAQKQRAVVRQESGRLEENEIHAHLRQIQQGLHSQINELRNQFQEQVYLMYNQQNQMQEQVNYLIAQQTQQEPFSCNASSLGGSFTFDVEKNKMITTTPEMIQKLVTPQRKSLK